MKKILIIEDEKNIILALKIFLSKQKYEVIVAKDGIEGIKLAHENIPDIILLDILLPKMNGYLVCKALKEESDTREIPVIFMSAKTQEEDIKKAFKVGGEDYIVKPFLPQDIKEVINKYLKEELL